MEKLFIIGLGATAEHVCRFVEEYSLFDVCGFAVDDEYYCQTEFVGHPVYRINELERILDKNHDFVFVAMLWNNLNKDRRLVYERLQQSGYRFANIISPTAKIRGELKGDNCWFHDFTIVQYGAEIGTDVMAMAYSIVGAKTSIGNHCFLGAKSDVAGECIVGEQTFVGINSVIFDARKVGKKCIVGACTAVKRDMPDYSACKVASDSMLIKQYDELEIENKLQHKLNRH